MVKKIVMLLSNNCISLDEKLLLETNKQLDGIVGEYKNKITKYHKNKLWDKYKKYSNEYELIYTSSVFSKSISLYVPLSRAFFKLWEILHDFNDEIFKNDGPINSLFLAESPGSFCEAVKKYRKCRGDDRYSGISLKSSNNNIPTWKFFPINKLWGKDNTGNLYNLDNIEYVKEHLGENTQDFITGDGGFDFSHDFNNQEIMSLRLIISEILCAIMLSRNGGCFILKIFDMFYSPTIKTLQILKLFWKKIYIIKPLTSRPANSEKYILCLNFYKDIHLYNKWTKFLKIIIKNYDHINIDKAFDKIYCDNTFLFDIIIYNLFYSIRQIYYIQNTIFLINNIPCDFILIKRLHERQILKSKEWCHKYNIPFKLPDNKYK